MNALLLPNTVLMVGPMFTACVRTPGSCGLAASAPVVTVKDMPEAARFLSFVLNYQADLQP